MGAEVTDPAALRRHWESDWEPVLLWDEAVVAAAFAELKLTGRCDPEVRLLALRAAEREQLPFREGWSVSSDRERALQRIRAKLRDLGT